MHWAGETPALRSALLEFQVRLIGLLGGGFAGELELGARREVLNVVLDVIRAGQRLPAVGALASGRANGRESQTHAAHGRTQPTVRGGLGHEQFLPKAARPAQASKSVQTSRSSIDQRRSELWRNQLELQAIRFLPATSKATCR